MANTSKALRVLVIYGGICTERYVSINSSKPCIQAIKDLGHQVQSYDFNGDIEKLVRTVGISNRKFDVVFNAMHGVFGEDGTVQGVLDSLDIPYTHSGRTASTYAMDKLMCRKLIDAKSVSARYIPSGHKLDFDFDFALPVIIKPRFGGSTSGISLINNENDLAVVDSISEVDRIVEPFIIGREFTVSVLLNKALAVTEIVLPKNNLYDEKTKYTIGRSAHICPAKISDEESLFISELAESIHKTLGCKGISRSDFKLLDGKSFEEGLYFLELNTQPGLTPQSLSPEQAEINGISFSQLISILIDEAISI